MLPVPRETLSPTAENVDTYARLDDPWHASDERIRAAASHDMRAPLNTIAGFADLLRQRLGNAPDKNIDDYLTFILTGVEQMRRLIDGLAAYACVGGTGEPFTRTDTADLVRRVRDEMHATIAATAAVVTADPLPSVAGDASQLMMLFRHLIANALSFRSNEPPRIHIHAQRDATWWRFSVRDNGKGISPANHEVIFALFGRLKAHSDDGLGTGLAICRKIVERHEGRIWVESQLDKGSTFLFTLPSMQGETE